MRTAPFCVLACAALAVSLSSASPAFGDEPPRAVIQGDSTFAWLLRDELPGAGVQVVSDERAGAVLAEMPVRKGVTPATDPDTFARFRARVPVEAIVFVADPTEDDPTLNVAVHGPAGIRRETFGGGDEGKLAAARRALDFVAEQCGLTPAAAATLLDLDFPDAAAFALYCQARTIKEPLEDSPLGRARAELLSFPARVPDEPAYPAMAATILVHAEMMYRGRRVSQAAGEDAVTESVTALPLVLGTRYESSAHAVVRRFPRRFDDVLLAQCEPLVSQSETTDALDDLLLDDDSALPVMNVPPSAKPNRERARGALRLLGIATSPKGLRTLLAAAADADASVREAAADGLGGCDDAAALKKLRALANDRDDRVALAAALGLWKNSVVPDRLLPLVRERAATDDPRRAQAAAVLADLGEAEDADALRGFCRDVSPGVRRTAAGGLVRLDALDDETLVRLLSDGHASVVSFAFSALPETPGEAVMAAVVRLANDPVESIAEGARLAATRGRPTDAREAVAFDLAIEHTYIRQKRMAELATLDEPWATELIVQSLANSNAYVRIDALKELVRRDAKRAHATAVDALADGNVWVRFGAANALTDLVEKGDADALRQALDAESDDATRICLAEALATATGQDPPAPPPAARNVLGPELGVWGGDRGTDGVVTPFTGSMLRKVEHFIFGGMEPRTQADGKTLIACSKPEPLWNLGVIAVDRAARDECRRFIDAQMAQAKTEFLDAYVMGYNLMGVRPEALWPDGWRVFCLDAGIDPFRVAGRRENLTVPENRAWQNWSQDRCVDAFNMLYDYVKTKVAKLRPGIQVGTFLPARSTLADARWKFDLAGVENLHGSNREIAYKSIRHYKTLWPDRPVFYQGYGWVGEGARSAYQRGWEFPDAPVIARDERAYADAVTAFAAGGDVGWWSHWKTHEPTWKENNPAWWLGIALGVDTVYPGSPQLEKAIAHAFEGSAETDSTRAELDVNTLLDDDFGDGLDIDLDPIVEKKPDRKANRIAADIDAEKEAMRRGFLYFSLFLKDCARVFSGLERQRVEPAVLAIETPPERRARSPRRPRVPAMALLNQYDYLPEPVQIASLDLARYRLIVLHYPGGAWRDETIAQLTDWLRETPGLLYVHGAVATDNDAEDSVVGDMDGRLANDWPWEADLDLEPLAEPALLDALDSIELGGDRARGSLTCTYASRDDAARVLASTPEGRPALVLWRRPGFAGGVLFDGVTNAPTDYLAALRKIVNGLANDEGIGLALEGPVLYQVLETDHLLAAATPPEYDGAKSRHTYEGIDLLTGEVNPTLGDGVAGVMIAHDYVGRYAAALDGFAILSENPLGEIARADGALKLATPGLIRVSSETGRVVVTPDEGAPLPVIADPNAWIIYGPDEGVATLKTKNGTVLTYYRCNRAVTITTE